MRKMTCALALLIAAGFSHPAEAATKRTRLVAGSPQQILCSIIDAACKKKATTSRKTKTTKRSKRKTPVKQPASKPKAAAPEPVEKKSASPDVPAEKLRTDTSVIPKPVAKPDHPVAEIPPKPAEKPALKTAEPLPKPETAEPLPKPADKPELKAAEPLPKPAEKPALKTAEPPPKPADKPALKTAVPLPKAAEPAPIEPPATPEKPQPAKPEPAPAQDAVARPPDSSGDDAIACRAALTARSVTFTIPDSIEGTGACGVVNPVQLSAVGTKAGTVALPGRPILNCVFARQFTTWLADVAGPTVGAQSDAGLAAFSTGPGYQCRGRNGDSSNKVSEHATGNAVDIDAVILADKRRIAIEEVANPQSPAYRMLMALRVSGCGYFTTVLGPGSNAAHATHYHFDMGVHGKSGNYRICE